MGPKKLAANKKAGMSAAKRMTKKPKSKKSDKATRPGKIGGRNAKPTILVRRSGRRKRATPAEAAVAELADQFRAAREAKGLTVAELAKATDIAPETILQFEDLTRPLMFVKLHTIAAALDHDFVCQLKPK